MHDRTVNSETGVVCQMTKAQPALSVKIILGWLILYSLFWLVLAGGEGLAFGAIMVIAATCISFYLVPPLPAFQLRYLPHFVIFFVTEMAIGGWDVARRALSPSLPIKPEWVVYSLQVNSEPIKLTLSALLGLMPGTLATKYHNQQLHLHVLDSTQDWQTVVTKLEQQLSRLMGGITK